MTGASASPDPHAPPSQKSVQAYIDETPVWADGMSLRSAPMTAMQWRIWTLAASGKFFEGLVVFMTGVALPLIAEECDLTKVQHGVIGAASLFGILVGAIGLGSLWTISAASSCSFLKLSSLWSSSLLLVLSPDYFWLVTFLFGLGLEH
jgi:hypothetical protein